MKEVTNDINMEEWEGLGFLEGLDGADAKMCTLSFADMAELIQESDDKNSGFQTAIFAVSRCAIEKYNLKKEICAEDLVKFVKETTVENLVEGHEKLSDMLKEVNEKESLGVDLSTMSIYDFFDVDEYKGDIVYPEVVHLTAKVYADKVAETA